MKCVRVAVLLVLFSALLAAAQTFRGGIQGTVTDTSGASIPDAQVTVTNPGTGLSRSVPTDQSGAYVFTELPPGSYNVSITKSGFGKATLSNVQVAVSVNTRADATLSPGNVQQTVEVSAEAPVVETSSDNMGGVIQGETAAALPVNGRDFTKLLVLVPGAAGDPSGAADSPGSYGLFSINGNRGRSNNYLLDGTDMNDGYRNLPAINQGGVFGTPATILPIDALTEVPVLSSTEAEYGRNSGAIVNLVTRSGTNTFHGSLYEFFRNNALDARNFFNPTTQKQDVFHNNQFGGSLGGPIVKDRTFFFVSYEGQRENGGIPAPSNVPTQAQINSFIASNGPVNLVVQGILNRHPWGTLPAGDPNNPSTESVVLSTPFTNTVDSMIAKIDQRLGGKQGNDLLTGRYYFGNSNQSFPLAIVGGGVAPGFNTTTPTRVQIVSLSYTHVISPKMLIEFRGGWNRFAEQFFAQDDNFNPATIGLNTLPPGAPSRDYGLPLITFNDGTATIGANSSVPRGRIDTNWQFFTNLSYTTGAHSWKTGFEWRRTTINGFFDNGYRGVLRFNSFDDFLAGTPSGGRSAEGYSQRVTSQDSFALYLQDSWRVTHKLTFNYGLRWDYYGVIGAQNNLFSILSPADNLLQIGTSGAPSSLYPKDWNNFAPRISLAYDLHGDGKTVLRAGYGLFYDAFPQDLFVGQLPFNTFNPGPAYNGIGPAPIGFVGSGGTTSLLSPTQPVYTGYASNDVFTVSQKLATPYVQVWNFNLEQQIANGIAFEIGYVGSKGTKLFHYLDINQELPDGSYPYPNRGYINQIQTSASSVYSSLQTSLKFQTWHRFTGQLNYTWSHSIDNASDGQDYVPNASQPDNSYNPAAERANSNFDTRHRLQFYWSYEFPETNNKRWLTSGWGLDGALVWNTGQPVNVSWIDGYNFNFNGSGEFYGRPDLVGDPYAGASAPYRFLNLSAFAVPCNGGSYDPNSATGCANGGHFGSLGRNAIKGPSYTNLDVSVTKNFKIRETMNLQFRADFFNILNHPNFSNPLLPNYTVDMTQNGLTGVGRGIGFLPITATPDVGIGNPFLGGGGPRDIQLALKFSF
jgi:outer membrane receptor protein involved in Fe transport